jgi:hypothetical protein
MAKVLFIQDVFYEHSGVGMLSAVLKSADHHSDLLILSEDRRGLRKKRPPIRRYFRKRSLTKI